jgi:AraC-like DNA-binding protein
MDTSLVPHAHHHCHVILKASGPDQTFNVEDQYLPVREDTAVLVNAWEQHEYVHQRHDTRTVFLALYIEPSWLIGADRSFAGCAQPTFFARSGVAITDEIRRLRSKLVCRIGWEGDQDPKEAEALIVDLTLAIVHQFADRRSAPTRRDQFGVGDFRIRRAIHYMREHVCEPYDFDAVARIAGLSRPHFNYLFRHCTGVSPGLYGNAIRVEASVRGLSEQQQPIAVIADDLGFSAQSNFTRFFQQHTGTAPSQFRRVLAEVS